MSRILLTLRVVCTEHGHHRRHRLEALGVRPHVAPLRAPLKRLQLRPQLRTLHRPQGGQLPLLGLESEVLNALKVDSCVLNILLTLP